MTKNILALMIVINSSYVFRIEFKAIILPAPSGNGNLQYIPNIKDDSTPPNPHSSFTPILKQMDGGQ